MHIPDLLIESIILTITPLIVRAVRAYIYGYRRTGKDHTPDEARKER